MEIMIDTISEKFLAPVKAGIRGHAWMMDGNGILLYHPTQPNMVGKNLNKADKSCYKCHTSFNVEKKILESGDIGFSSYIAPYGEDKLLAFSKARIGDMSWIVCVSIPYSEVTLQYQEQHETSLASCHLDLYRNTDRGVCDSQDKPGEGESG